MYSRGHKIFDVNYRYGLADDEMRGGAHFVGMRFQRGVGMMRRQYGYGGIRSLAARAWKYLVPFAKKHLGPIARDVANALAVEGATAGSNILKGVAEGKNLKESLIEEGGTALRNVARKTGESLA